MIKKFFPAEAESGTFAPVSLINAEMRRKTGRKKKYRKYINRGKEGNYFEQAGHFKTGQ